MFGSPNARDLYNDLPKLLVYWGPFWLLPQNEAFPKEDGGWVLERLLVVIN